MRLKTGLLLIATVTLLIYAVNRNPAPIGTSSESTLSDGGSDVPELTWAMLRGMNSQTGKATPEIQAVDEKPVRVPGYIVPLDDDANQLTEFLLVPYNGACVHTPPPPPNQMIFVKMTRGQKANFGLMDAVWVEGTIFLGRRNSPYGPAFYSMTAREVTNY